MQRPVEAKLYAHGSIEEPGEWRIHLNDSAKWHKLREWLQTRQEWVPRDEAVDRKGTREAYIFDYAHATDGDVQMTAKALGNWTPGQDE